MIPPGRTARGRTSRDRGDKPVREVRRQGMARFVRRVDGLEPALMLGLFGGKEGAALLAVREVQIEPALRAAGQVPVQHAFHKVSGFLTVQRITSTFF